MTEEVDGLLREAREINALVAAIKPILAGVDQRLQGAVLAELTAIWIWGHRIPGDDIQSKAATLEQRRRLLAIQDQAVSDLVKLFDAAASSNIRSA